MIWSRKQLVGPRMALDVVNPKILELEVTKEILSELSISELMKLMRLSGRRWKKGQFTIRSLVYPLPNPPQCSQLTIS